MLKLMLKRKTKLLQSLETLQQTQGKEYLGVGICEFIGGLGQREDELLRGIFRRWPKFSGNDMYPVPPPKDVGVLRKVLAQLREDPFYSFFNIEEITPHLAFLFIPLWEGEYGQLREELLEFLINDLKADINGNEMSIEYKKLLVALKVVERNYKLTPNWSICTHISHVDPGLDLRVLAYIFSQWPKFSGSRLYPVPAPKKPELRKTQLAFWINKINPKEGLDAAMAFNALPKWEGEYGRLREELLAFSINKLEELIEYDYE